jgi:hypothetical protein
MPKKEVKKVKSGKSKKVIISIGIAILFVMFVAYAVESSYPSPKYERYCNITQNIDYQNKTICEANNGTWTDYNPKPVASPGQPVQQGYCDLYTKCNTEYQNINEKYNRNVFFISLAIGIIILLISFIPSLEQISLGTMSGALLLIIYGTIRYWGSLSNIWKTIMIGFALVVLIWISYKKLNK